MAKSRSKSTAGRISLTASLPQPTTPNQPQPTQTDQGTQGTAGNDGGDRGKFANMTYQQFMSLDEQSRFNTIQDIINATDVKVPNYLDPSDATKVVYALGMTNKPQAVDDATLDGMKGRELFRGVYNAGKIKADDIIDQIKDGDYTQFSNSGGSAYGRGLYFTGSFSEASGYAERGSNSTVMRVKIASSAKVVKASTIDKQIKQKGFNPSGVNYQDLRACYAISQGISGWYDDSGWSGYTVMVDRGALVMSKTRKKAQRGGSWSTATTK